MALTTDSKLLIQKVKFAICKVYALHPQTLLNVSPNFRVCTSDSEDKNDRNKSNRPPYCRSRWTLRTSSWTASAVESHWTIQCERVDGVTLHSIELCSKVFTMKLSLRNSLLNSVNACWHLLNTRLRSAPATMAIVCHNYDRAAGDLNRLLCLRISSLVLTKDC